MGTHDEKHDLIINSIPEAIRLTAERGLRRGDLVAHVNYKWSCMYDRTEGETAFILDVFGEGRILQFPENELFDPNILMEVIRAKLSS